MIGFRSHTAAYSTLQFTRAYTSRVILAVEKQQKPIKHWKEWYSCGWRFREVETTITSSHFASGHASWYTI